MWPGAEEVDEDASLVEAVAAGRIRGAVLDVYDGELAGRPPRPELIELPQILLTPHISGSGDTKMAGPSGGCSPTTSCGTCRKRPDLKLHKRCARRKSACDHWQGCLYRATCSWGVLCVIRSGLIVACVGTNLPS